MTERRKTSTSKKIVENAYLRKPVLNNIMTTHTHTHTHKKMHKIQFLSSFNHARHHQCLSYQTRWKNYCAQKSIVHSLNFSTELFNQGVSYSVLVSTVAHVIGNEIKTHP